MSRISKMRSLLSSETSFPGRSNLPVAMFTERALNKRYVPHPVNPVNPEILIQTVNCNSSPDNVSGGCGGRLPTLSDSRPTET